MDFRDFLENVLKCAFIVGASLFWLYLAFDSWYNDKETKTLLTRILVCFYPSFIFLYGLIFFVKYSFFTFNDYMFFIGWFVVSIYGTLVISDSPKHRPEGSKFFKIAMLLTIIIVCAKVVWSAIKH